MIAEGIETVAEFDALKSLGVTYFQVYLFAKPQIEQLPTINPALSFGVKSQAH